MTTQPEPIDSQAKTFDALRDAVACLVGSVAAQGEKAIEALGLRQPSKFWSPSVDVVETGEQVVVTADLPGVDPAAIDIVLVGNMLTIKGEQAAAGLPPGARYHRQERPPRAFQRSIPLPVSVDPAKVDAQSKLGVLTITLARQEQTRPTHIRVATELAAMPPHG